MGTKYLCNSCEYKWESRKSFGEPSICPKCKKDNIIRYYESNEGKKELQISKTKRLEFYKDLKKIMKKEEKRVSDKLFMSQKKKVATIKNMKKNPEEYFWGLGKLLSQEIIELEKKYNGRFRISKELGFDY